MSTVTTELTSKKLKLHSLLAAAMLIIGMLLASAGDITPIVPGLLMFCGLVWFIVTRIRIWWGHS